MFSFEIQVIGETLPDAMLAAEKSIKKIAEGKDEYSDHNEFYGYSLRRVCEKEKQAQSASLAFRKIETVMFLSNPRAFHKSVGNMIALGGSFVKALGRAARLADEENKRKLLSEFFPVFKRYLEF